MKKLKFFMIGLVPGLIIVFFVLNKKGVSCSGYLPNSRVIAETLSKDFEYSDQFKSEMNALKIDEKFLKDSIITNGKIDFDRSHVRIIFCLILKKNLLSKSLLKSVKKRRFCFP